MNLQPICVALRQVPSASEDLNALAARFLDTRELALLSSRSTRKRRAEFIAGRIAAREAVSRLLGHPAFTSFQILRHGNGPTGRPRIAVNHGSVAPEVSISHADGLAVAAANFGPIGLDLASIQPQNQSFVADTFSPLEINRWAAWLRSERTSALTLTTAFTAKEAALKWLGTGFGIALRAIEILPAGNAYDEQPASFPVPTLAFPVELRGYGSIDSRSLSGRFVQIGSRISIVLIGQDTTIETRPTRIETKARCL
jgi:phosphopantetheinyl transferase